MLVINVLNKKIELFNFKKFKNKKILKSKYIRNNILPISIGIETQKKITIINKKYTEEELIDESLKYSINKMKKTLNNNEYIYKYSVLNKFQTSYHLTSTILFSNSNY